MSSFPYFASTLRYAVHSTFQSTGVARVRCRGEPAVPKRASSAVSPPRRLPSRVYTGFYSSAVLACGSSVLVAGRKYVPVP
jgi:hypothetical protein